VHKKNTNLAVFITIFFLAVICLSLYLLYNMIIINPDMGVGRFIQTYWPIEVLIFILYTIANYLYERYYK
jgi:hypothetical protein